MPTKIECPTEDHARLLAQLLAKAAPVSTGYSGLTVTTDADDKIIAACQRTLAGPQPYRWTADDLRIITAALGHVKGADKEQAQDLIGRIETALHIESHH
jgi:hypothetical protein